MKTLPLSFLSPSFLSPSFSSPSFFSSALSRTLFAVAAPLLFSASAWAHVTVGVHIGVPGAVYVAPPVYAVPVLPRRYLSPYAMPRVVVPQMVIPQIVVPMVPLPRPALGSGWRGQGGWQAPRSHGHHGGGYGHSGYGGHRHR